MYLTIVSLLPQMSRIFEFFFEEFINFFPFMRFSDLLVKFPFMRFSDLLVKFPFMRLVIC